jgi:hypothetical protein
MVNGGGGPSVAASSKNMLRREVVTAINDLHSFIMHNMTIELSGSYHFGHDICSRSPLCPVSNAAVQIFFEKYFSEKVTKQQTICTFTNSFGFQLRKDPRISLQWPILRFFENKFFLPANFYGVSFQGANGGTFGSSKNNGSMEATFGFQHNQVL